MTATSPKTRPDTEITLEPEGLLPCPFCGGPAEIWRAYPENPKRNAWIACMGRCVTLVSKEYSTDAEAIAAWNRRSTLPREGQGPRKGFPILNSGGQKIDWQLVADHGEQAKANHYQTVERLAERGGLSWCELYAVLHNKPWQKMDQNDALIACRVLEARYLSTLSPSPAVRDGVVYPAELTEPLREVLSTMLWNTGHIARCLRAGGEEIKTRAEDEQAHVLHWMIGLALQHGDDWKSKAADRIEAIKRALSTQEQGNG